MTDPVLAAIIAASATIFTSLLQLRASFAKDATARSKDNGARRKGRSPVFLLITMILGSGVGGFALSQWVTENERVTQESLRSELRDRINELTRATSQLEIARASTRAEIEASVLRRFGTEEGASVMAMVPPCKPTLTVGAENVVAEDAPIATPACTEADASPIMLCATIPASAVVREVELYTRDAGTDTPWNRSLVVAGIEHEQSRFADQPVVLEEAASTKQVCQSFVHWSTDRARTARMIVRYTM